MSKRNIFVVEENRPFLIMDTRGRVLFEVGVRGDGEPYADLRDPRSGRSAVSLEVVSEESGGAVMINGPSGDNALALIAYPDGGHIHVSGTQDPSVLIHPKGIGILPETLGHAGLNITAAGVAASQSEPSE